MKFKQFVLFAALLSASTALAQPERGTVSIIPRFGATLANMSNEYLVMNTSPSNEQQQKGRYREGLTGGVDIQYQATDELAFSGGVFYARQGCKYKDSDLSAIEPGKYAAWSNCHTSFDYINIPLMAHYYLAEGFAVNAGIQPGFLVHKNIHVESTDVTLNKDGSYTYTDQISKTDYKPAGTRSFDFSIPIGLSYEYANVVLDVRYNIGLTHVYKDLDTGSNRVFNLTVGYKFNL